MRNEVAVIFSVFLVALAVGWGSARAADPQDAGGFKVVLSDGGLVNGALSFVINLDTEYGQIHIPSSSLVSARFDQEQGWADVRMNSAELKMKYKPASSDLKATLSSVGPITIGLAKVVRIERGPAAATGQAVAPQASAPAPSATYESQTPPVAASAPTVTYQYPYQYQYVPPATYDYYPPDYYSPYYWPGPYDWGPDLGFGVVVGPGFGGFRGGFRGGIRGGFGGGFHGGFRGGGGFGHGGGGRR